MPLMRQSLFGVGRYSGHVGEQRRIGIMSDRSEAGSTTQQPIVLAEPDEAWAARFANEAVAIAKALSTDLSIDIHHIGSTSIPGIVAKPVIDMLGVVASVEALDAYASRLTSLGYEAQGEYGIPGRRYFRKNAPDGT